MHSASVPATNSANPKSPPPPSSGPACGSAPPVSHSMSPSGRAMNPSTLMPRKTEPVKGASMPVTLSDGYDDSVPVRRGHHPDPALGEVAPDAPEFRLAGPDLGADALDGQPDRSQVRNRRASPVSGDVGEHLGMELRAPGHLADPEGLVRESVIAAQADRSGR